MELFLPVSTVLGKCFLSVYASLLPIVKCEANALVYCLLVNVLGDMLIPFKWLYSTQSPVVVTALTEYWQMYSNKADSQSTAHSPA